MILRIVKLSIKPDCISAFKQTFDKTQSSIKTYKGCQSVELFQETANSNVYFTLSYWDTESDLENYRNSDFFQNVWSQVKPLFSQRAEAWSLKIPKDQKS